MAEKKLRELGLVALPDLEKHAGGSSDEVSSMVCLGLISELNESDNIASRDAASAALTRLAKSKSELVSQQAIVALRRPLLKWIEKTMNGVVVRDTKLKGKPILEVKLDRTRWGIDSGFQSYGGIRNEDIKRLAVVDELQRLTLEDRTSITDPVFGCLADLPQLRNVNLSNTSVNGSGFVDLPRTSIIETLNLSYCGRLDDNRLNELSRLPELKTVVLNGRSLIGQSDELWRYSIQGWGARQPNSNANTGLQRYRGGVSDLGIENLCRATGLEEVSLNGTLVTDQALGSLAKLSNLRSLKLNRTAVTDAGIKLLESSKLEEISLAFTFVTDKCISSLAKLKNLRRLNLSSTAISGKGIEQLSQLPNLESVNLEHTLLTDNHMDALAKLKNLKELKLSNTRVSLGGLLKFAENNSNFSMPQLLRIAGFTRSHDGAEIRDLSLRRQRLLEESLGAISQLHDLESLNFSEASIVDEQLERLQNLSDLKSLDLSSTKITDSGVERLGSLTNLESIRTAHTKITFSAMRKLFCDRLGKSPPELIDAGFYHDPFIRDQSKESLHVNLVHRGVEDDDLATLAELGNLCSLKLAGNPITDHGILEFSPETGIELIWISGEGITGESLRHLAGFRQLKTLWVTDASIDNVALQILSDFKELEILNLCGCLIDDSGIDQLAQLASLQTLLVSHDAFSKEGIDRLKSRKPELEVILSAQGITRRISGQPELYQYLPPYYQGGPHRFRGGGAMEHPLKKIFGPEFFFQDIRSLVLLDEFDCSGIDRLESVESVSFGENIVREGALDSINRLPKLQKIHLYRSYIDDNELRHLSGMSQLEQLNLERSTVTDEGLKQLGNMPGLKSLMLGGYSTRLSPGCIASLGEMPNLQELSLSRAPVTDESAQHIVKFSELKKLNLSATQIGEGVKLFSELTQLEELNLDGTFITDKELGLLAKMKLKELSIGGTYVSKAGVQDFKQASPETRLSGGSALSDEVLELLEPLRQKRMRVRGNANQTVRYLDLRKEVLVPQTVDLIGQLPEIEELKIAGPVTDELVQILADKPAFQSLTILRGAISNSQLKRLHAIPTFETLNLYDCQITLGALKVVGEMTQLQRLALYKTQVDGQVFNDQHIERLKNLKSLTWLNLNDTEITDQALRIVESFPKMQRLYLNRTRVTDKGVYPVSRWSNSITISVVGTKVKRNGANYGRRQVETRSSR